MFPYFEQISLKLGPLTVHVWGLFIALGLGVMLLLLQKECRARKLKFDAYLDMALWVVVAAFVGARLSHVFLYEPGYYFAHLGDILKVWQGGLSSFGGIVFGTAAALLYVWRKKLPFVASADAIFRSMPAAWAIGRFGCYLTHMHPGEHTTSLLGVRYPDGVRFDLGLFESFFWILLWIAFWATPRSRRAGLYFTLVPLLYAPVRFGLDFLRAHDSVTAIMNTADIRYSGLTPAQLGMIALFIISLGLVYHYFIRNRNRSAL